LHNEARCGTTRHMNRIVVKVEREALSGVLRARVEVPLENFYTVAAAELKTDTAELLRPVLRAGARQLFRDNKTLRRSHKLKSLLHGL
jgi:hypothetical protein